MQCAYTAPIVQPTECLLGYDTDCGQGYNNDWTENDKLAHVKLRIAGTAAHVLSGGINAVPTYSDLVEKLEKRFGTKDQSARYRSQLKGRRRQKSEVQCL